MSLNHNAFVFAHAAFEAELRPTLDRALETSDVQLLASWIEANRSALCDPYEGEELPADWESLLTAQDVQEYADFALTKYYDPSDSIGLDEDWAEVEAELARLGLSLDIIQGSPFGPAVARFDPARSGAYLQSPATVRAHLQQVEAALLEPPAEPGSLELARDLLAAAVSQGLYVTF